MAYQDTARLEELLAGITVDDAGLQALLAGLAGVKTGRTDTDDVPEPPEEPYLKPGELYVLGDHRLLAGPRLALVDDHELVAVDPHPDPLADELVGHVQRVPEGIGQTSDRSRERSPDVRVRRLVTRR